MGRIVVFIALLTFTIASGLGLALQPKTFISPDGKLTALVFPVGKEIGCKECESRVELRSSAGKMLAAHDYSSKDGEHGYGVAKATWTPDSQFFVYSLGNPGGHQPWHSPVHFYSKKQNKFLSLDDAVADAVMNPNFEVSPPDKVTVELWFSKKKLTVSLAAVATKKQE